MSQVPSALAGNRLLASLPERDRKHLLARCDPVELVLSDVLFTPGEPMLHVYFPTRSFISVIARTDERDSLEVALVGDEGMLGLSLMLGVTRSPLRAQVQGAGSAWRIEAVRFQQELARSVALRTRLNLYACVRLGQIAQLVACTHFHRVEARLARWLLMTRDRAHSDDFRITHEFLANILGVRRAGVTRAAGALQARRLIRYSRGRVDVLDARGLEKASCSCYRTAKAAYTRTLS
ncbi:MAG TPA: Crp/Fnr family transcriptional regulator [Steroidobacteraceae bacterium]|nr:Crp/Fnr family transcriptional regulator [Steroidobacteraceae bacterium]